MSRYQPMQPQILFTTRTIPAGGFLTVSSSGHRWPIPVVWDPYSWYRSERTPR